MDLTARKGMIFDIMRFCVHDGPGIRTTVFLKGCPLRCLWCHNPEGQESGVEISYRENRCRKCGDCISSCPSGATYLRDGQPVYDRSLCTQCGTCVPLCLAGAKEVVGREVTVAALMRELVKDIAFYEDSKGGVTFSGGEPVQQPVFLEACLTFCHRLEIHTAVETSGFASEATMARIARHTDLFLYDIKHMDDEMHRWYTGVSNERILQNLRFLAREGKQIVVRIPMIPGVNDGDENMIQTAEFVASLESVHEVHLLPFHGIGRDKYERIGKEYGMPEVEPLGQDRISAMRRYFECYGMDVKLGG